MDITVVFEHDYRAWLERRQSVASLPSRRSAYSLMVLEVPSMTGGALRDFVLSLSELAEHLYITTNLQDYYESFTPGWLDFVREVPA